MNLHPELRAQLEPIARRRHHSQLWRKLALAWGGAALIALALLGAQRLAGWSSVLALPLSVAVGVALATVALIRSRRAQSDWRAIALELEAANPELQGRLLTAVQQTATGSGKLDYLQERVIAEAVSHARGNNWGAVFPQRRVLVAQAMQLCSLVLFGLVLWHLRVPTGKGLFVAVEESGISVSPGDTELERGSSLVVAGRFVGTLPPAVELVYGQPGLTNARVPLVRSLADPLFSGTVPDVRTDLVYHLEYGGKRTRDYQLKVFDFPRLERADADVSYPDYTGLKARRLENTRRISAVEGSKIQLALQLNKVVAKASMVSKDTNQSELKLSLGTNAPSASLDGFPLAADATFDLQLIDMDGRTNKVPAQFVFKALKNLPPELKVASPRGDTQPSPLEEISFEGTVFDDFGVQAFGLATAVAGKEIQIIELGRGVPRKDKRSFKYLLHLEELGLQTGDLMSWFVWADDIGPDGKVRRTTGDLFFAEVRPFEEIFREGQSSSQEAQQQQQQQPGSGGSQSEALAELQKQIISATWKLIRQGGQKPEQNPPDTKTDSERKRDPNRSTSLTPEPPSAPPYRIRTALFGQQAAPPPRARGPAPRQSRSGSPALAGDLEVVSSAQERALEQAQEAGQSGGDPRAAGLWEAVIKQMERALENLRRATNSPAQFQEALAAEQAAYQALLKLREREYSVSRNQTRQRNQSGRQQQMRQQLDQLDLSREQNRYESERQAQAPQTAERSEQLQVMNRLQELARRQQDLNERLKEMQTALQEAQTEADREEVRRQLKRLQEEQQEVLADADEVRQRMERSENQSRMSEQSQQMEQARNELQRATEAAQQGQTSQALASGTRAQRQLQQMRDDMRRQTASEFEDELRQMRSDARELAHRQEEIQKKMDALRDPGQPRLSDAEPTKETLEDLAGQRQRLTNLVEQATQLSRAAEEAEPLVSRELYETLRNFSQNETSTAKQFQEEFLNRPGTTRSLYERLKQTTAQSSTKSLDLASDMLRLGLLDDANVAQERARAGIDDLKRGVERAAQNVLGDDAQSLRLASEELDRLSRQLEREIAQAETAGTNRPQQLAQAGAPARDAQQQGGRTGAGRENEENPGERTANQPGTGQGRPETGDQPQSAQQQQSGAAGNPPSTGTEGQGSPRPQSQDNPGQSGELAAQQPQSGASNEANRSGRNAGANPRDGTNRSRSGRTGGNGGGGALSLDLDRLLEGRGGYEGGPITGEDFAPWSDRLREVEELVDTPSLRTEVARARERARQVRQDFKRNQDKPDWASVRLQVLKPLVEVRNEINEELARREPNEQLVPIDRDPVPNRYSEAVRKYYEQLGKAEGAVENPPLNPKD